MLSFGDRLRVARSRKKMTQMDVYRLIGLSNKSLSRYENGTTAPDPDTVRDLIRLYDVSADFIMGLSDEMGRATPPAVFSFVTPKMADATVLLEQLSSLSPESKKKAIEYLEMLKTLDEVKSGG